jgi:hypothetical protein
VLSRSTVEIDTSKITLAFFEKGQGNISDIIKDIYFIENVMLQITSAFFEKGRGNQSQLNNGVFGKTTLAAD